MENKEIIATLKEMSKGERGRMGIRFFFNSLGCWVPFVSAATAMWGEDEQRRFNDLISELSTGMFEKIEELSELIAEFKQDITPEALFAILKKMFDEDTFNRIVRGEEVPIMISNISLNQLLPFKDKLIFLNSTHASANMGAGCRAGNHIEEILNPFGMGMGFVIRYFGDN